MHRLIVALSLLCAASCTAKAAMISGQLHAAREAARVQPRVPDLAHCRLVAEASDKGQGRFIAEGMDPHAYGASGAPRNLFPGAGQNVLKSQTVHVSS